MTTAIVSIWLFSLNFSLRPYRKSTEVVQWYLFRFTKRWSQTGHLFIKCMALGKLPLWMSAAAHKLMWPRKLGSDARRRHTGNRLLKRTVVRRHGLLAIMTASRDHVRITSREQTWTSYSWRHYHDGAWNGTCSFYLRETDCHELQSRWAVGYVRMGDDARCVEPHLQKKETWIDGAGANWYALSVSNTCIGWEQPDGFSFVRFGTVHSASSYHGCKKLDCSTTQTGIFYSSLKISGKNNFHVKESFISACI